VTEDSTLPPHADEAPALPAPAEGGAVTLEEVAALAGVSTMTVSRVLRDQAHVTAKTRDKVKAAIAELGYVPNRLAGALASARTRLIVVIVPSLGNIVFPDVLRGINAALEPRGFQAVMGISDYDLDKEERLIETMMSWRPSGWILAGLEHTPRARQLLKASRCPVVEVMDVDGEPIDMAVGLSHRAAGARMAAHFLAQGRRRLGYVGGDLGRDLRAAKRLQGFEQALQAQGLSLCARELAGGASSLRLGRGSLQRLLAAHPGLDGVYFSNDDMAMGGLMHCLHAGIAVPGQLALAGFNGLEIGEVAPQRLSTVGSPRYEIGQVAAQHLLQRLEGGQPPAVTDLGFEFIAGETA